MDRAARIQRRAEIARQQTAINNAGEGEHGALTEAQQAEFDNLTAELTAINQWLANDDIAREAARNAPAAPEQGQRAANVSVTRDEADQPWGSLGENLLAIAQASIPGGTTDARLLPQAVSGASAGNPASGGFLIGTEYTEQLLGRAREESVLMPLCRQWPVSQGNDGIEYPYIKETSRATGSRWGGVRVYRRKEAATVEASRPDLEMAEIRLHELMGIAYATDRLLRNAATMEAIFADAFASEFAFKVDDEIFRGTGAGEMLGFLTAAEGNPKIAQAKEAGQPAGSLVHANLSKMWTRMSPRSKSRAVWFVNQELGPQFDELSVPAGTGAIEPRIVRYTDSGVLVVKGRPVREIEHCEAPGTEGDIVLADLNQYVIATQGALEQQESMHLRFLQNEMAFRWTYYINGQPLQRSAVTPYKGTATTSPIVTLATRA